MAVRLAENNITAHYDKAASDCFRQSAEWAKRADRAVAQAQKEKYLQRAREFAQKGIDALETAKAGAAGRGKK